MYPAPLLRQYIVIFDVGNRKKIFFLLTLKRAGFRRFFNDWKSKKLIVFYCYTGKPLVDIEEDCMITTLRENVVRFRKAEITIPINTYKSGVWYQIEINKEEDFDLIEKVVSSIMEDNK